jgi:hypothetical protein
MTRITTFASLTLAGLVSLAAPASAQIVIRAPFVRVEVGGGVYVRAPFVTVNTRPGPVVCAPALVILSAPPVPAAPVPPPPVDSEANVLPAPRPLAEPRPMTVAEFAASFKPQEGSYDVVILNPLTNAPTNVRFSLPAGTPRDVRVNGRDLQFDYGAGQWVRIRFGRVGARVTSHS